MTRPSIGTSSRWSCKAISPCRLVEVDLHPIGPPSWRSSRRAPVAGTHPNRRSSDPSVRGRDRDLEAAVRPARRNATRNCRFSRCHRVESQQDLRAGDRFAVRVGDLSAKDDRLAPGFLINQRLLALRDRTARGAGHLRSGGRTPGLVGSERRRQSDRHARNRQEEEAGPDPDLGEHQGAGDAARQCGDGGGDDALDRRAGQAQRAGGADRSSATAQPGLSRAESNGSRHRLRG